MKEKFFFVLFLIALAAAVFATARIKPAPSNVQPEPEYTIYYMTNQ